MLEGLMTGLAAALSLKAIAMVVIGCLIGTFIGMLPGLGPMSIIAIMIPFAVSLGDPTTSLIMLAGVYYGAVFGGSTSSILINAPGVPSTVATSFDGYPLARAGKAGKALTIAAVSSFAGGTIGAILLTMFAGPLAEFAKTFWSAEYFALMVAGLTAIAAFAGRGQVLKAILMVLVGLMLATVGQGALFNQARFTMGVADLESGVGFVTLIMALFALPEALFLVLNPKKGQQEGDGQDKEIKDLRITKEEARKIAPVIGRQSIVGFLIGVMPGAGATIASFIGYATERNLASPEEREQFGKGSVKGLSAPETANNAASTGSFVPMLTLGIPGSGTTAILLGALIALGVTPGPALIDKNPEIFWGVIISMYLGNVVLLVLNLPLIPYIAKLLTVPRAYLIPFVLFFSLMGAYIGQNNVTELYLMIGLAAVATLLRFADYPLPPIIIGFILGVMLEDNLGRSLRKFRDLDWMYERPVTLGLLIVAVLFVLVPLASDWRARMGRAKETAQGD